MPCFRRILAFVLCTAALLSPHTAAVGQPQTPEFGGFDDGDSFVAAAIRNNSIGAAPVSHTSSDNIERQYVRSPGCVSGQMRHDLAPGCVNDDPIEELCLDGSPASLPLWSRERSPGGDWSLWSTVTWYTCDGDAALMAAIESEWASLTPGPVPVTLQPDTGWVYAMVPTIGVASDEPHVHSTTLLGVGVQIRATPVEYTWDWGDGTVVTTTDPGRPFPDATVTHTYERTASVATVHLTVTWRGEYAISGGSWIEFDSTVQSTSSSDPLDIHHPRSRLVGCDLNGQCSGH